MAAQMSQIVASFLENHTSPTGEVREESAGTYLIQRWMFPELWTGIVGLVGRKVEQKDLPDLLGAILLDVLAGDELEGHESAEKPQVTFVVDFEFTNASLERKRFAMINRLRQALGKAAYIA